MQDVVPPKHIYLDKQVGAIAWQNKAWKLNSRPRNCRELHATAKYPLRAEHDDPRRRSRHQAPRRKWNEDHSRKSSGYWQGRYPHHTDAVRGNSHRVPREPTKLIPKSPTFLTAAGLFWPHWHYEREHHAVEFRSRSQTTALSMQCTGKMQTNLPDQH